ncbi:MAG TPA: endonuclease Q family protein [Candidatus Saccharimonadales bacterium]|nr:endonuclease Q family protein [Candidatus Saccharimonadales bacterium]
MQELIVDLHVHSHYSRATSKNSDFEGLYRWGKLKGITVIGTGDCTHPAWFAEMRDKLEPAEGGFFKLKAELAEPIDKSLPASVRDQLIRFVPSVEIATIYSKGGKVRKLHQLIIMPTFEAVSELNARLERIGNLKADGRPILGLDSKELLRHSLEVDSRSLYIPAHIWTPWFGMFGSKSGFDSIEEAYEELAPEIHAIETGLSSDPGMNWRVKNLDNVTITSHSDAHSPGKLGREATVVKSELSYDAVIGAIKTNDQRLIGTIEFFPEEGKYHYDGHRDCGVRLTPAGTRMHGGLCPVCGKPLVVGVENRLETLAERPEGYLPKYPKRVEYIIPLAEILAELHNTKSAAGKAVTAQYHQVLEQLGNEFDVLRSVPLDKFEAAGFPLLKLAIERLRAGNVVKEPGYDGVYGTIKVFKDASERQATVNQLALL